MKLSVITICYNIKDEIERTCQSIVSQTNQEFEWIVVDGGSTDGTVDILNKYKDRMTVFISEPDKGIYNAMNKGIKRAKGEYLNFMNGGDCFASSDVVEKFIKFQADNNADIIYGNMNLIKEDALISILTYPVVVDKYFFLEKTIGHQATFIKRQLFAQYGLYNENYRIVSDWEKWIIFAEHDRTFKYWDYVVANFDNNGISSKLTPSHREERENVIATYYTPAEIQEFERRNLHKYNILLFGFIPLVSMKNYHEGAKIICKLFNLIPLYKIKRKNNKSTHYLFGVIPFIKLKGK